MKKNENEYSQEKVLHSHIMKCNYIFIIGIVCFMLLLLSNHMFSDISTKQTEVTYYLNMFRDGSKNLTIAVSSFAASGKTVYKENYYYELEEVRSREVAVENLLKEKLKQDEIEELNRIVELSNNLVPNENMAFQMIESGLKEDAKAMIFSSFYKSGIDDINNSTDMLIASINQRLERTKDNVRIVQVISEFMFAGALLWLLLNIIETIGFARKELLQPVVKVSNQLMTMAKGDLHTKLDLKENESEVGQMASAIRTMKENWSDMIYEIAFALEQMSEGNYLFESSTEYVGEFVTIKECLYEIVDGMKSMIKTISEASKDIDQGADGLASASESLANACSTQAMELSNILIYLQGITEKTRDDERDAEEAVKIAHLARSTVDMEEMRINRLVETLDNISHCIEEMSAIIEVTALTDDTQNLIDRTLTSISETIASTNEAISELDDIRLGTEETIERAERIVNNFKGEVDDIDKIAENLSLLAGSVDNNSATAEETAAISEQQRSQVANLVTLIDKFKI